MRACVEFRCIRTAKLGSKFCPTHAAMDPATLRTSEGKIDLQDRPRQPMQFESERARKIVEPYNPHKPPEGAHREVVPAVEPVGSAEPREAVSRGPAHAGDATRFPSPAPMLECGRCGGFTDPQLQDRCVTCGELLTSKKSHGIRPPKSYPF